MIAATGAHMHHVVLPGVAVRSRSPQSAEVAMVEAVGVTGGREMQGRRAGSTAAAAEAAQPGAAKTQGTTASSRFDEHRRPRHRACRRETKIAADASVITTAVHPDPETGDMTTEANQWDRAFLRRATCTRTREDRTFRRGTSRFSSPLLVCRRAFRAAAAVGAVGDATRPQEGGTTRGGKGTGMVGGTMGTSIVWELASATATVTGVATTLLGIMSGNATATGTETAIISTANAIRRVRIATAKDVTAMPDASTATTGVTTTRSVGWTGDKTSESTVTVTAAARRGESVVVTEIASATGTTTAITIAATARETLLPGTRVARSDLPR